jgi:alkylation response protein AidB-like acyl-CoA dehydrogenase
MNFDAHPADDRFRAEVRSFLKVNWSKDSSNPNVTYRGREAFAMAARLLREKRWLAPGWPVEWGGADLPPAQRYILEEELSAAGFPPKDRIAIDLAGPVIYTFGSLEQKRRYLPCILAGEEIWCQGFSEPDSGSDVNSVQTSATRDGSHYIVEGRKLWTSHAHFADMMFALVRLKTEAGRQHGLTFLLISMRDPNVAVRPVITIDGRHHLNEVSLNKVRVPASNVVGEPGRGWHNARFLLRNERVLLSQAPRTRQALARLIRRAASQHRNGRCLLEDLSFKRRLAQLEIDLQALEFAVLRVLHASQDDTKVDGLACAIKIRGSELRQRVSELAVETLGDQSLIMHSDRNPNEPRQNDSPLDLDDSSMVVKDFLFDMSTTIAGGTSEIQRNLIAGLALGL